MTDSEYAELPWAITFSWKKQCRTITLKNGEDVLRLADIFKEALNRKGIEYTESTEPLNGLGEIKI